MRKFTLATVLLVLAALAAVPGCSKKTSEEVKLGGIDTTEVLQGLLDRTARTLGGVRDMASAEKAAGQLKMINDDYDDLLYHVDKLSPKGRGQLAGKARNALPEIQAAADRINASGPLADLLGPQMGAMLEKLTQLAAAPEA
jgi:hypothetical protein